MKSFHFMNVCASLLLVTTAAHAQFVKGNEAVTFTLDGIRQVDMPTLPAGLGPPCPAARSACAAGGWKMLETLAGLQECTEFYARPGTCKASTYGTEKRPRVWVVKSKSQWLQCQFPALSSKCVSTKALPFDAIQ